MSKSIGLYIHIPFCRKKCYYCDFLSFEASKESFVEINKPSSLLISTKLFSCYFECLTKEITSFAKEVKRGTAINTLYIGGGTPSYVDSKYIIEILNCIKINYKLQSDAEITIEVNPGTANKEKLQDYFNNGINRLSIGLQSADDKILKSIGRIHNFNEFLDTYKMAREIGFNNINVDIMLGLPNQSIKDIEDTLNKVLELKPEHIATYSLIIEENTKLAELINSSDYIMPNEETERQMYWYIKKELEKNVYKHYEISNFALDGVLSKHNMNCWRQQEYVGFGLGAHSYRNKIRYSNVTDMNKYINDERNIIIHEKQTKTEMMKEYMLLGLRIIDGVNIEEFKQKFQENPLKVFKKEIEKLLEAGYILIKEKNIKLSEQGIDFANYVWREFV